MVYWRADLLAPQQVAQMAERWAEHSVDSLADAKVDQKAEWKVAQWAGKTAHPQAAKKAAPMVDSTAWNSVARMVVHWAVQSAEWSADNLAGLWADAKAGMSEQKTVGWRAETKVLS